VLFTLAEMGLKAVTLGASWPADVNVVTVVAPADVAVASNAHKKVV